jgi:hypothetical protein
MRSLDAADRGAHQRRRRFAVMAIEALLIVCTTTVHAHAWRIPASAVGEPPCTPIPDAKDLELTADERARVDAGEIVVRLLRREERGGLAQAVGYLDANPVWLFDVSTDSTLATDLAEIIRDVEVVEERASGKVLTGVARPTMLLPGFAYKIAVSYLDDATGQCWSQLEGDFEKNGGSHAYLWDPSRGQSLAVFTFEIELKGMFRMLPQSLVTRLTARTLPAYMRALESLVHRLARDDAPRASRVEGRWKTLHERLETAEADERVWRSTYKTAWQVRNADTALTPR